MRPVLFVFLDGVGLAPADPRRNPLAVARMPALERLLGGLATLPAAQTPDRLASLAVLEATLGVPGLPQSGTGQTALLTGHNAPQLLGRHFGPWTPTSLRPLLAATNMLVLAVQAGRRVAFANAYPEELFPGDVVVAPVRRAGPHRPLLAGPPLAALAAGLLTRHTPELARGEALASEITNEGWRQHLGRHELPVISPTIAGRNLARIAANQDLTLFAHYATDTAGHTRTMDAAVAALELVDEFLGGVVEHLPPDMLLIVASDHGNLEDIEAGHTRNPALGLLYGPGHAELAGRLHALTDITPLVLDLLECKPAAEFVPPAPAAQYLE